MAQVRTKPGMQMYDNIAVRGTIDGDQEEFELADSIIAADTGADGKLKENVAYELVGGGGAGTGPNAKTIIGSIPGLSDAELAAVEDSELERADGGRTSVLNAIKAEQDKRVAAAEAAAKAAADALA